MQWYYVEGQDQPKGPISEAEFQVLVKAGSIGPATLVWREDLSAWTPYQSLRPGIITSSGADKVQCLECRQWFSPEEVIRYENHFICGGCKPLFIQKVREGVAFLDYGLWRQGNLLVIAKGVELPDRCIKCNKPADGFRLEYKMLPMIILSLRSGLQINRAAPVRLGLCRMHRLIRKILLLITGALCLGVLTALIATFLIREAVVIVAGIFAFFGLIVFGMATQFVSTAVITKKYIRLSGAGEKFLAALPVWRSREE